MTIDLKDAMLGYVAKVRELIDTERRSNNLGSNIRADGMELIADGVMSVIESELPEYTSSEARKLRP